ncbi:MAG: sulfatase-like hydrolase/transferase, partial [Chitinophagales bacterium]|nr:sulfatase-like hydrolase/transferase [Chitinophagales bacterium]
MLFFAFIFSNNYCYSQCSVPKPKNITVTKMNSCSATIKWNASANAAYYVLWYKMKTGGTETTVNTGTDTFYTVTGLSANTSYQYKTSAYCSNNTTKGYSKLISAKTLKCSVIENLAVSNINDDSALVLWSAACGATNFKIRYRLSPGNNQWTVLTNISSTSFQLTSLTALTNYEVQGSALCGTDTSLWSSSISFQTASVLLPPAPPNIVIILEDDGRYDTFKPTGGPSFFESPAINRLAYEGVNFKYSMPASSQCTPSRVSIYTGLYPHHHGAVTNGAPMITGLPMIQQILKDNGYYTGFVGKTGQSGDPIGFDWYAKSLSPDYVDPKFKVNGITSTFTGHYADISEKFALQFLDTVPEGQPFLLMFFTVVPHGPTIPKAED